MLPSNIARGLIFGALVVAAIAIASFVVAPIGTRVGKADQAASASPNRDLDDAVVCEDQGAHDLAAEILRGQLGLGGWVAGDFEVWRPFHDTARIWIANGESGIGVALGTGRSVSGLDDFGNRTLSRPNQGGYSPACKALLWTAAQRVIEWQQAWDRQNVSSAVKGN